MRAHTCGRLPSDAGADIALSSAVVSSPRTALSSLRRARLRPGPRVSRDSAVGFVTTLPLPYPLDRFRQRIIRVILIVPRVAVPDR